MIAESPENTSDFEQPPEVEEESAQTPAKTLAESFAQTHAKALAKAENPEQAVEDMITRNRQALDEQLITQAAFDKIEEVYRTAGTDSQKFGQLMEENAEFLEAETKKAAPAQPGTEEPNAAENALEDNRLLNMLEKKGIDLEGMPPFAVILAFVKLMTDPEASGEIFAEMKNMFNPENLAPGQASAVEDQKIIQGMGAQDAGAIPEPLAPVGSDPDGLTDSLYRVDPDAPEKPSAVTQPLIIGVDDVSPLGITDSLYRFDPDAPEKPGSVTQPLMVGEDTGPATVPEANGLGGVNGGAFTTTLNDPIMGPVTFDVDTATLTIGGQDPTNRFNGLGNPDPALVEQVDAKVDQDVSAVVIEEPEQEMALSGAKLG